MLGNHISRRGRGINLGSSECIDQDRPMWRFGFGIFVIANLLGSSFQITTLPLTILAPLHASGLVYNAILASLLLGETFNLSSLFGTIMTAAGATLIASFGAIEEPSHTLPELLVLFARKTFLIWMGSQVILVAIILLLVSVTSRSTRAKTNISKIGQGAALGCVAGMLAAHCLLLAKTTVELLLKTFVEHENQFLRWEAWVIPLGLIVGAPIQLFYLNRGLRLCSTSILYPLNFSIYNIVTIVDGLIYYRQGSKLSKLQITMVLFGTVLLLMGVMALSLRGTVDEEVPESIPGAAAVQNLWHSPQIATEFFGQDHGDGQYSSLRSGKHQARTALVFCDSATEDTPLMCASKANISNAAQDRNMSGVCKPDTGDVRPAG